ASSRRSSRSLITSRTLGLLDGGHSLPGPPSRRPGTSRTAAGRTSDGHQAPASGVDEDRGAEGDSGEEEAHGFVGGADAAEGFGAADAARGAVDREAVAADPAGRERVVLVAT